MHTHSKSVLRDPGDRAGGTEYGWGQDLNGSGVTCKEHQGPGAAAEGVRT